VTNREVLSVLTLCVPLLLGAAPGCADDALDRVRVCGDLSVPADLVAVRVTVLDEALTEVAGGVVDLDGDAPRQLPVDVAVTHIGGRRVIRAQAIGAAGVEVGRAEVYVANGGGDAIVVNLARDCLGQVCAAGQTCRDGACTVTPDAADPDLRCDAPAVYP
jgi:hypothetical protein